MKTYLITGGAGFIGSHFVTALLSKGNKVVVVDNFDDFYDYKIKAQNLIEATGFSESFIFSNDKESDLILLKQRLNSDNFSLYLNDINDDISMRKIYQDFSFDGLIHLAALAGVRPSIERPMEYEKVNVQGTLQLLEFSKEFGITNNIIASSSSVYGNNKKIPFQETDVVDFPISPYASTKKSSEINSYVYHSLYGLDILQLRFFTVYGPRQRPDLAIHKFANLIADGQPIPFYGDGTTARDYTYIDDIISGMLQALNYLEQNNGVYEIINLGENEVITLEEMVKTLEKAMKKTARITKLPMQSGDVQRTNADISKAKKLLGYNPKTSFDKGIEKFITWFNQKETNDKS